MFHKHLRERISDLEAVVTQFLMEQQKAALDAGIVGANLRDHSTRLDDLWSYILMVDKYVRFGAPGKISVKYGEHIIALPLQEVLDAIIDHLGMEYVPGRKEVATPGRLIVKKDWE